jgi:hypothetical protein
MGWDDIVIKIAFGLTGGAVAAIATSIPLEVINTLGGEKDYSTKFVDKFGSDKINKINDILKNDDFRGIDVDELAKVGVQMAIINQDNAVEIYKNNVKCDKIIALTRAIAFIPGVICGVFTANKLLDKLHNLS